MGTRFAGFAEAGARADAGAAAAAADAGERMYFLSAAERRGGIGQGTPFHR